jgi:hypothetical protein
VAVLEVLAAVLLMVEQVVLAIRLAQVHRKEIAEVTEDPELISEAEEAVLVLLVLLVVLVLQLAMEEMVLHHQFLVLQ